MRTTALVQKETTTMVNTEDLYFIEEYKSNYNTSMLDYNMNTFMLSSWFTNNLLLVRKYAISICIYI